MFGLSIRTLLIGLLSLLALTIGGQGYLALAKIAAVNAATVDIATNWLPSVDSVRRISAIAARIRLVDAAHIMSTDNAEMEAIDKEMVDSQSRFDVARKKYEPLISSDAER